MALVLDDRVKETSTTTGTGPLDLDGAVSGFQTFVAGIADTNTTFYAIVNRSAAEWETGIGTIADASPDTLTRTSVIASSNSDSAVDLSAGTKDVFCTLLASKAVSMGDDRTVDRINLKDYGEVTNALGDLAGGTDDIDLTAGNVVTATVSTGTQTFTFSNPTASDEGCSFTLILTNGGSQTVNWPASVAWAGGDAPSLSPSGVDLLVFMTVDGGTIWHGMVASTDSS